MYFSDAPQIEEISINKMITNYKNIKPSFARVFVQNGNSCAKTNQAEELLDVPLSKYEYLYKNMKSHEIFGYRTKQQFYGSEFTTVVTYNEGTYKLQKSTYEANKSKIIDQLADLKRRLDSNKGKARCRSSVESEVTGIILEKYRSVIKYEIIDVQEGQKKPQLRFWVDEENDKKCEKKFGKNILFTDKQKWHT